MSVRIIIALWICTPIAIALVLIGLRHRTLFGDRVDDVSSEGADEGGRADFLNHGALDSEMKERNLG